MPRVMNMKLTNEKKSLDNNMKMLLFGYESELQLKPILLVFLDNIRRNWWLLTTVTTQKRKDYAHET